MGKTKLISLFLATCIPVSAYSRQNIHFDTDTIADTKYSLMINPDTVLPMKVKPWQALAEDLGVNAVILAFDRYVQNRSYARVTGATIKHNFRTGFVWDNDSFSGNQFSHPYHGSMFYNAARQNGLNYWQSLAYPIIGSLTRLVSHNPTRHPRPSAATMEHIPSTTFSKASMLKSYFS